MSARSKTPAGQSLRIYRRILSYILPYTGHLVGVLILNFFFVVTNTLAIWMVAPFLTTLFRNIGGAENAGGTEGAGAGNPATGADSGGLESGVPGDFSIFQLNDLLKEQYARFVERPDPVDSLQIICLLVFVTFFLKNVFQFGEAYLVSFVEQKVIKDLRDELFHSVVGKPLRFFSRFETGNLISRITNDISALNVAVNRSFTKVIRDPLLIVTFVAVLVSINWKLTLFALLVIPATGFVIQRTGQSLKRRSRREQERIADVTARLQDKLPGIRVIQAFGQEETEAESFRAVTERHFRAVLRKVRMNRLAPPLSETLGVGIMVAVLWFGGRMVLVDQTLTAEDFIRFLAILFAVLDPIKSLANLNNNIQIAVASGIRVFEVIDHPEVIEERPNAQSKTALDSGLRFDDVWFRYDEESEWALRRVSFQAQKHEKIALVGPSGAGKTTITNLLPRFYDVDRGQILLDGVDIRDIKLRDLRRLVGMVAQDVILFNDTVAANIAYGLPEVTRQQIEEAARLANALGFIRELPQGFDTMVGERGVRLSGGERQRISIARAILLNPPILIFDEATSALDSESEQLIQQAMDSLLRDRTVLIIAHRLSSIRHCDQILVIDGGELVDRGTHDELLTRSSAYERFHRLQFETEPTSSAP